MTRARRDALRALIDQADLCQHRIDDDELCVAAVHALPALLDRLDEAERLLGEVLPLLDNCTMSDEQACASVIEGVRRFVAT